MTRLRIFLARLGGMFAQDRLDGDLQEQIAAHLAEATDEYVRQGLSPEEARRAARRSFARPKLPWPSYSSPAPR